MQMLRRYSQTHQLNIDMTKTVRLLYHFLEKVQPKLAMHVGLKDDFFQDWGISHQDCLSYILHLEQHFNIHIQDQERQQVQSIQGTIDYLLDRLERNTTVNDDPLERPQFFARDTHLHEYVPALY